MKAVGYTHSLPINDPDSLQDIELPMVSASGHDVLIKVQAIAVNPVDYKIRLGVAGGIGEPKVLGWDAVGEVIATGEKATQFKPGDHVYYAGDLNRQGSNAEYQVVDERLVGAKPKSLSVAEAAALPLTTITAWELLAPFGKIAMIDDPEGALDVMKMKPKSISLHIEFMFARSMFKAKDMGKQGRLLTRVADLIDLAHIQTTVGKNLGKINAKNLKKAHEELETGKAVGKIVLEGF